MLVTVSIKATYSCYQYCNNIILKVIELGLIWGQYSQQNLHFRGLNPFVVCSRLYKLNFKRNKRHKVVLQLNWDILHIVRASFCFWAEPCCFNLSANEGEGKRFGDTTFDWQPQHPITNRTIIWTHQ